MNRTANSNTDSHYADSYHVGSFLLLILLATVRIEAFVSTSVSLAMVTVAAIMALLVGKIYWTIGFVAYWQRFKWPLLLSGCYLLACGVSFVANVERYHDRGEVVKYAITPLVVYGSFVALASLFVLPQNQRGLSLSRYSLAAFLPWLWLLALAWLSIWQKVDFASAKQVTQYFVAAELWPSDNVNGFFRISTDLGAVLGVGTLLSLSWLLNHRPNARLSLWLLVAATLVSLLLAGLLSGARVYFLLLLVAGVGSAWVLLRHQPLRLCLLALTTGLLFHVAIMFAPTNTVVAFNHLLAYLLPLHFGDVVFWQDLLPRLNFVALEERGQVWLRAMATISEHWGLGISNGGFRLGSDNPVNNSHSILFQPLIDGGIVALLSLLALLGWMFRRLAQISAPLVSRLLLAAVIGGLLVDFQPDHSLPWCIAVSYFLAASLRLTAIESPMIKGQVKGQVKGQIKGQMIDWLKSPQSSLNRTLLMVTSLLALLVVGLYWQRQQGLRDDDLDRRIGQFVRARDVDGVIVLDKALGLAPRMGDEIEAAVKYLINQVDLANHACLYQYGDLYFIQTPHSGLNWHSSYRFTLNKQPLVSYRSRQLDCHDWQYGQVDDVLSNPWLSDSPSYYLPNDKKLDWPLWINTTLSSSLWAAERGVYQFSFNAKGQFGVGQWPNLTICMVNGADDRPLSCQQVSVDGEQMTTFKVEFEPFAGEDVSRSSLMYMTVAFDNDARDLARHEDRNVWLSPQSFRLSLVK